MYPYKHFFYPFLLKSIAQINSEICVKKCSFLRHNYGTVCAHHVCREYFNHMKRTFLQTSLKHLTNRLIQATQQLKVISLHPKYASESNNGQPCYTYNSPVTAALKAVVHNLGRIYDFTIIAPSQPF